MISRLRPQNIRYRFLGTTLLAAAMLIMTLGTRQTLGLFVAPIKFTTEVDLPGISLAMAQSCEMRIAPMLDPA
ncbi:MAG: hypothetical protein HY308_14225 [Gammaproteobacteria bacterium]|nr:hypothetical protein [Gammaproteobacteria bacterium]